jgi:hypothetical protein
MDFEFKNERIHKNARFEVSKMQIQDSGAYTILFILHAVLGVQWGPAGKQSHSRSSGESGSASEHSRRGKNRANIYPTKTLLCNTRTQLISLLHLSPGTCCNTKLFHCQVYMGCVLQSGLGQAPATQVKNKSCPQRTVSSSRKHLTEKGLSHGIDFNSFYKNLEN